MPTNSPDTNKSRKSITLFRSFSREEMSDFCRFIQNNYFNKDEKLVALAEFLNTFFWRRKPKNFDADEEYKAYTKTFGKAKSTKELIDKERAALNDKLSKLTKLGVRYLLKVAIETDGPKSIQLLLDQFTQRKLPRFFDEYQKKENRKLQGQDEDRDLYRNHYYLERNIYDYIYINEGDNFLKSNNLPDTIKAFDVYYLVDRMLLQLASMTLTTITPKSYDLQATEHLLNFAGLPAYKDISIINLCRIACRLELCKLQSAEDEAKNEEALGYFEEFVVLLREHDEQLTGELAFRFYNIAINFCSYQIRRKNQEFHQRGFDLYRYMDKKNLLIVDEKVREGSLIRAATLGCRIADFKWTKTLLNKHIEYIATDIRDGVSTFIQGKIAFYQKDFEKADEHFRDTEDAPYNRYYTFDSKILRLKCMYELRNYIYEAAQTKFRSEIQSRKKNKQLTEKSKEAQINFIKALTDLYKIKGLIKREKKERIAKRIENTKKRIHDYQYVTDSTWLMKKVAELETQNQ